MDLAVPGGNQWRGVGGTFHLTHRCHNRSFQLKFGRDREASLEGAVANDQVKRESCWTQSPKGSVPQKGRSRMALS